MITTSVFVAALIALLAPLFVQAPVSGTRLDPTHLAPLTRSEPAHATILFGGDMMFDRYIRQASEREGGDYVLACIADTLHDADLVVANLEGPITEKTSVSVGTKPPDLNNFTFTFPTSTAALLARHNIGLVNLGNNHIMNFGENGVMSTMVALSDAGVGFFGSPLMSAFVSREIGGITFEFVSYNEFGLPGQGGMGRGAVSHQIQAARSAGRLPIVYTHWGDEYVPARESDKLLAREFIDAGAEIVIGSHPHVIQEHELYKGKHIYYSLGNLVFDQYWEEAVRTGLLVKVTFTKDGVENVEETLTELQRDGRTCLKVIE